MDDGYLGSGKFFTRALAKYGIESFSKEILFVFETQKDMSAKEAELVTEEFCSRDDNYNLCPGGKGGWGYINANKLANTPKQRLLAKKSMEIAHQAFLHKFRSNPDFVETWKKNLSISLKQSIEKNGTWNISRPHSEETKAKIGKSNSIAQSGSKNSQFGSMWITDGTINKKINKLDNIPEGWNKGRK